MCDSIFGSPQAMRDTIGKEITITTLNGVNHNGFVYNIDPMSKSVVLTDNSGSDLIIIPHHAIKKLVLGTNFTDRFGINATKTETSIPIEVLEENKQKLMKWLKDNLIEVVEDGRILRISDHVSIEPPYDIDHCYCTNTVILERLRNIIKRMP